MSRISGPGAVPPVSIIVPTYNRPHLLVRAVRSVQAQTVVDWELVCVDDGSVADARVTLAPLGDARIRVIRLPSNQGASRARNVGLEAARAELIAFLDDDNEWRPGLLEAQLARLDEADGARAVAVHCLAHRRDEATGRVAPPGRRVPEGDVLERLVGGWCPFLSCTIIRRAALLESGGFDAALTAFQDYDLFLRLAWGGAPFVGVSRPLVVRYERHAAGTMSTDPARLLAALVTLDGKWRGPLSERLGRRGHRRWRARLEGSVAFVRVREAMARGEGRAAWRAVAGMAPLLPRTPGYPVQAVLLAALGQTVYDRLARLRDGLIARPRAGSP